MAAQPPTGGSPRTPTAPGSHPSATGWREADCTATPVALSELGGLRAALVAALPIPIALRFARTKEPTAPHIWVACESTHYTELRRQRALVLGRDEWAVLVLGTCVDVASSALLCVQLRIKAQSPHMPLTREWLCAGYAHTPVVIAYPSVSQVCSSWGLILTGHSPLDS